MTDRNGLMPGDSSTFAYMYKATLSLGISLAILFSLNAQIPAGPLFDTYGSFPGVYQQPSTSLSSPYGWEFNLGVQTSFSNNYIFLRQAAGLPLLLQLNKVDQVEVLDEQQTWLIGDNQYEYDYFDDGKERFGRFETSILGPSLAFRIGPNWRIGIGSRLRAMGDVRRLDTNLSYLTYSELAHGSTLDMRGVSSLGAAWLDLSLHLAHRLTTDYGEWGLGLNVRRLQPLSGAVLTNADEFKLTKVDRGTIGLQHIDTRVGLSGDLLADDPGTSSGSGWALDLAIHHGFGGLVGEDDRPRIMIGLAIIDLGVLHFGDDAEVHQFKTDDYRVLTSDEYRFAENGLATLPRVIDQLNRDIYGSQDLSLLGYGFDMNLPTRIQSTVSMELTDDIGLDGRLSLKAPLMGAGLRSPQALSVGARFSRWWYGGGISMHYHDFEELNLGLYIRLGPLYLGTDRLMGSLLKRTRLYTGSGYVGLRIHAFGRSSGKDQRGPRKGGSRFNRCYEF